jgi:hypothetical protein
LCIATDTTKKELDGLLNAGRQACGSLQIAGSSNLTAIGLTKKLLLVPGLMPVDEAAIRQSVLG